MEQLQDMRDSTRPRGAPQHPPSPPPAAGTPAKQLPLTSCGCMPPLLILPLLAPSMLALQVVTQGTRATQAARAHQRRRHPLWGHLCWPPHAISRWGGDPRLQQVLGGGHQQGPYRGSQRPWLRAQKRAGSL